MLHASFNLIDAFNFFDSDRAGFITLDKLRRATRLHGSLKLSSEQLKILMRSLDRNGDGKVDYAEFIQRIMPKDDHYSQIITDRGHAAVAAPAHGRELSMAAKQALIQTLLRLIELEQEIDVYRSQLSFIVRERTLQQAAGRPSSPFLEFSLHRALSSVHPALTGSRDGLGVREFRHFLLDNGITATDTEISLLLLRFDKQQKGKISFTDLLDEILAPTPPSSTLGLQSPPVL